MNNLELGYWRSLLHQYPLFFPLFFCQQKNGCVRKSTYGGDAMITITNIKNINYADYDEVWAIVRSLKNPGKMKHVPELSPSWNLFKKYLNLRDTGKWNAAAFQNVYVPTFSVSYTNLTLPTNSLV